VPLRRSFLALAALLAVGCDHPISVRGRAYRKAQGSRSIVLFDQRTVPAHLEPLKGVKITVYHSAEDADRADYVPYQWNLAKTGADGAFEIDGTCGSAPREMAVRATLDGCDPALGKFIYTERKEDYEATILMACPQKGGVR
jgi:hypothetical protein